MSRPDFAPTCHFRWRALPQEPGRRDRSVLEQLWIDPACGDASETEWRRVSRVDEHGAPSPLEDA